MATYPAGELVAQDLLGQVKPYKDSVRFIVHITSNPDRKIIRDLYPDLAYT